MTSSVCLSLTWLVVLYCLLLSVGSVLTGSLDRYKFIYFLDSIEKMSLVKKKVKEGSALPFFSPNVPDISATFCSVDSFMNDTIMMPSVRNDASL